MGYWVYIACAAGLTAGVLALTGWWRLGFAAFAIRPKRMTVDRLGLLVDSPEDVNRVDTILRSFAGGFNVMITARSVDAGQAYCDSLPILYQPFAQEGTAMGYTLRHLFRYRADEFEERVVKPRPEFRYLHYVGLGFWSAMRNHDAKSLARIIDGLDPLHRYLCYDGYGFGHAFFKYPKDAGSLRQFDDLDGYARKAAYQGVGRAFYFLFMSRPAVLVEHIRKLGDYAPDAAAGVGLAAVFVNPDRLEFARDLAAKMPREWHESFHLGMCFGLKARSLNDVEQFEHDMSCVGTPVREAVFGAIRECDRIELLVRDDQGPDGYRRWREQVTAWMADHIEYPLAAVKDSVDTTSQPEPRDSAHVNAEPELRAQCNPDLSGTRANTVPELRASARANARSSDEPRASTHANTVPEPRAQCNPDLSGARAEPRE